MEEHEVILSVITAMERKAMDETTDGELNQCFWYSAIDFIQNFTDRHHLRKEEDLLFPALVEAGFSEQEGPVAVMRQEHQQGRELVQRLRAALEAGDLPGVTRAAGGYALLLREHIQKENMVLFNMARHALSQEKVEELLLGFQRLEKEDGGLVVHRNYVDLAKKLCADSGTDFQSSIPQF